MIYNTKQFKLASGEEIVCDVIEWASENCFDIIVKNIMEIVQHYDRHENEHYYLFRPWVHFQENDMDISILDSRHIIATSNLNYILMQQYKSAVMDMHVNSKRKIKKYENEQKENLKKLSEIIDKISSFDSSVDLNLEENYSNVIQFPTNDDKIH